MKPIHGLASAGLLLLGACATAAAPQTSPADAAVTQFANLDGGRVAYQMRGHGRPAVVFEAGFGGELDGWDDVAPHVAAITTTFAYDRPGRGGSDPNSDFADGVRSSEEAARFLHRALEAAHVPPPYVLVGVSLGGLYVQKFAALYPDETAGIVLVDNRPATYQAECRAAGVPACQNEAEVDSSWSLATQATFRGIAPSEAAAPSARDLGAIPVTLLTATATQMPDGGDFIPGFIRAQTRFAGELQNGRQIMVDGATHETIVHDYAETVANEIALMVRAQR